MWRGLAQGVVDVLGSDHAPHTLEEKARPYPESPSGMTGVQTLVPIMLDHVAAGRLTLQRFVDLTSAGPARIFGIVGKGRIAAGYDADFTVVDLKRRETIRDSWIASRCGWTPYDGKTRDRLAGRNIRARPAGDVGGRVGDSGARRGGKFRVRRRPARPIVRRSAKASFARSSGQATITRARPKQAVAPKAPTIPSPSFNPASMRSAAKGAANPRRRPHGSLQNYRRAPALPAPARGARPAPRS